MEDTLTLEPMPPTVDRRPYDDEHYPGYLESDTDWALNNWEAVRWLADNHSEIRKAINTAAQTNEVSL